MKIQWKKALRLAACAAAGLCIGLPLTATAQDDETPDRGGRRAARDGDRPGTPPGPNPGPPPEGRRGDRGPGRPGPGGPPEGFRGPGGPGSRGPEMLLRLPVIAALDADHDGVISAEEISGASAALKKLDRNEDGMIDFLEMRPTAVPRGERGPGGPPAMDRPRGERGPEGRGPFRGRPGGADASGRPRGGFGGDSAAFIDRLMERDGDGDGLLTAEEMPPLMARMVERADENKDAKLSREELEKAMAERGRGMRRGAGRPGAERETPGGERPRRPPLED